MSVDLHRRLLREFERWQTLQQQIKDLEKERRQRIRRDETPQVDKVPREEKRNYERAAVSEVGSLVLTRNFEAC